MLSTIKPEDFTNIKFDTKFDIFLYKTVGYDNLRNLTKNIFYSPYGATSLREYFANGFEAFYYHKDIKKLKGISPILYKKCVEIMSHDEGEEYEYK